MIKWLEFFHLRTNAVDTAIIRNEFFRTNLQRLRFYPLLAVPVSLAHIIIFLINLDPGNPSEYTWRFRIIIAHCLLLLLAAAAGIYGLLRLRKNQPATRPDLLAAPLFYFFLMLIGAWIARIDQQVTTSITPFLVVCLLPGLLVLVKPVHVAALSLGAYLFFFIQMGLAQPDPDALLSNRVNGLTAVALSIGLASIMWTGAMIRSRQRRQIEEQKLALEQANATKDRFFSIIAHDLVSPIAGISTYLELIKDNPDQNPAETNHQALILKSLRNSVKSTLRLIENLLTWARTQRNEIEYTPVPTDVALLIRQSVEAVRQQATLKKISLALDVPEIEVPATVDPNMLQSVFRNLLTNAIKFSWEGSSVRIGLFQADGYIHVSFKDEGVGIPKERIGTLFDLANKSSTRGTGQEAGTGLGLVLCHEFVGRHKGEIRIQSEPGKGSTFTVILPVTST